MIPLSLQEIVIPLAGGLVAIVASYFKNAISKVNVESARRLREQAETLNLQVMQMKVEIARLELQTASVKAAEMREAQKDIPVKPIQTEAPPAEDAPTPEPKRRTQGA